MAHMNCPSCGLDVALSRGETARAEEVCPRCLARSSGAVSVHLRPGPPPRRPPLEQRVIEALRRRAGRPVGLGT